MFHALRLSLEPEVDDAHLLDEAGHYGPTFPQVLWPILYRELVVLENALHMVMTVQQRVGRM